MPTLTNPRHERFAQEYLVDLNAAAAYRRTYPDAKGPTSEANGIRLLGNAKVETRIAELKAERAERTQVTQDWVIAKLVANVERSMQAEPVYDRQGNPTGDYIYLGAVANGALKLLGLHLGMFPQRHANADGSNLPPAQVLIYEIPDNGRGRALPSFTAPANGHARRN
jgi:phage terminase small subunit